MIFVRDMVIHQSELINWERKAKQHFRENLRENRSRSNYKYTIGKKVLVLTKRGGKLIDFAHKGLFEILEVFKNRTIKLKCNNFEEIIHKNKTGKCWEATTVHHLEEPHKGRWRVGWYYLHGFEREVQPKFKKVSEYDPIHRRRTQYFPHRGR